MASSLVELVNNALVELGEPNRITSMGDPSRVAILANQKYASVRDAVLRAYPWNCAIARTQLAPLGTSPKFDWTYQFQLPPDCLRVLSTDDIDDEWKVEGRYFLYNSNVLNLIYIQQVTDVTQFDALLCEAISSRLAHALAIAVTGSNSVREQMWENYKGKLREARSIDAQESMAQQAQANDWVDARQVVPSVQSLRKPV